MNYWIEKTLVSGRPDRIQGERALGKVLWSPQKDKRGGDIYKNMRKVNAGDIVFHFIDNKEIAGVSVVKESAIKTSGLPGTPWDRPAYLIELRDYEELDPKIDRNELLNYNNKAILDEVAQESEVFYNRTLSLRQGAYLTPCPTKLVSLLASIYKTKHKKDLPHVNSSNMMEFIHEPQKPSNFNSFQQDLLSAGLQYSDKLITRFIASLLTKPFLILTGLSGSGKTKLAQAFAQWICGDETQYRLIPVGADWTNREPLLGYPNALKPDEYVKPDSGVLDLIIQANNHPELPHFLILDEMNLSIVERYFADFLSVMESRKEIPLYPKGSVNNGVPDRLSIPENLFIIGTVNIDETTNMFSPKVLDRANTIEFRVTRQEMQAFLNSASTVDLDALTGKGAASAYSFLKMAANKLSNPADIAQIKETLMKFFGELKKTGAEFGYRSAVEILRLIHHLSVLDDSLTTNEEIDIAIMQKLLPKLHGSRRKLCSVLETLGSFCLKENGNIIKDVFDKPEYDFEAPEVLYPLSLEKITRMYRSATENGFASFAEA